MFNTQYEGEDAILMIYSIPINSPEDAGAKSIAERVIEIVSETEKCFTTLDYAKEEKVEEDKVVYVLIVKRITNGG
jgi:hypothetical protein